MHWYGGSIAEAVTLSKQKNAIFVVFVEGDNDLSTEMAATIDDAAVVSRLSDQANFLAVKLKSGTTNYTHFAQIYQFVPVPSLFFIGRNGTPLEVVCAGVQATNLATRIDRILAEHHFEKPALNQPSTSSSSQGLKDATVGLIQSEIIASTPVNVPEAAKPTDIHKTPSPPKIPKPSEPTPPETPEKSTDKTSVDISGNKTEYEVVCDGDVCVRRPKATDQPSTSQATSVAPPVVTAAPVVTTPPVVTAAPLVSTPPAVTTPPVVTPSPVVTPPPVVMPPAVVTSPPVVTPPAVVTTPPVVTPPAVVTAAPVATSIATPVAVATPVTVAPMVTTVTRAATTVNASVVPEASSTTSVEEKLERAKELLEAKRREKAEKEKELERQKELERRNTGQGVAELKKWQADQEMKQIQEERKREKLENNLARQRILEQIAQDRAERKAKDSPAPLPTPSPLPQQASSHLATSGDGSTSARVQFKLPDGTSHTAHFDAAGTLALVQRYVADNLQLSASSFALWTAFPRRELTDSSATLRELELAPSAALLVLPRRAQTPSSGPTQYFSVYAFLSQLLTTYFYQPSLVLYTWIRTRLFPPPAVGPRPPNPPTIPPPLTTPLAPRAAPLPRRRTNIHRLPGDAANDDDNNTWNGNSTQQM